MHPTRDFLAHQRRLESIEPKAVRLARPRRYPILAIGPLAILAIALGILVAFHWTHQGRLPRDRYELATWLTSWR